MIGAPPSAIFDVLADPRRHTHVDGSGTVHESVSGDAEGIEATLPRLKDLVVSRG